MPIILKYLGHMDYTFGKDGSLKNCDVQHAQLCIWLSRLKQSAAEARMLQKSGVIWDIDGMSTTRENSWYECRCNSFLAYPWQPVLATSRLPLAIISYEGALNHIPCPVVILG